MLKNEKNCLGAGISSSILYNFWTFLCYRQFSMKLIYQVQYVCNEVNASNATVVIIHIRNITVYLIQGSTAAVLSCLSYILTSYFKVRKNNVVDMTCVPTFSG